MTHAKNLGIFMDHSTANLMEFTTDPIHTKTLSSNFSHEEKEQTLSKSENLMHNKENHKQADYYKKLAETILNYEEILLFGPTEAKTELHNIIKADHRFDKIKIKLEQTDKLTENQQHAYVKDHFAKPVQH